MGETERMAAAVADALTGGGQIPPFGDALDAARARDVAARWRAERDGGARVGRKIGFTNRALWPRYGVTAPIWGEVTEASLLDPAPDPVPLAGLAEPRIEPEMVLGLAAAPSPDMDEAALAGCVGWAALGFEIVQSIYPGWRFSTADAAAANGLHGRLILGARVPAGPWLDALPELTLTLSREGAEVERGRGDAVLGGPLSALRHLVEALADDPQAPALAAGELVSTGTLTDAWPVAPGQAWRARTEGAPLGGVAARFG